MELSRFIRDRERAWQELEATLDRAAATGLRHFRRPELRRLVHLYRQASSDLIEARARLPNAELCNYLNALVARAYAEIYTAGGGFGLRAAVTFLRHGFPALLSRHRALVLLAVALFTAGTAVGFTAVMVDPAAREWLVPAEHRETDPRERVARLENPGETEGATDAASFSSFLFTHNIRVAFTAFALGITFGIGTAAILFANGVMLGSLAADYHLAGRSLFFWAWILPHGVPELTSIFIAGGSGFFLARALLRSGREGTVAGLAEAAPTAVRLVLGTIPIFVLAGLVEGSLSQIHEPRLPYPLKLVFAALEVAGLFLYFRLGGSAGDEDGTNPTRPS